MNNLQVITEQLGQAAKVVEELATVNETRAEGVATILEQAQQMQKGLSSIEEIVESAQDLSMKLKILSLNTEIECARINNAPLAVIAKEIRKLSDLNDDLAKNAEKLAKGVEVSVGNIVEKLKVSSADVLNTSASLEELTASAEEIYAMLEELTQENS